MRFRALLTLFAGIAACSPTLGGGLKVTVRFLDTDAQCAKVFVTGSNNVVIPSGPLTRIARDRTVGIAQDAVTGPAINVEAKGFLAADCSGVPVDVSKTEHREFIMGDVSAPVLLVLKGGATPDAGMKMDAGPMVDSGVPDSGIPDAGSGPDAGPEQCGNGVDDDKDGVTDCFDGDCLQQDCLFGRRCTSVGVCAVPTAEASCSDGLDDDGDGMKDCADNDCNNKSCADVNACTYGEKCQANVCTPTVTLACMSPNECQMGAGTCLSDAGCGYLPKTGGCDGGTCMNGECIIGFPFAPSNGFVPTIPSSAVVPSVKLDCGISTFNSDTLVFGNWCGQTTPMPRILNRLGIQNIVVLPMAGLELDDELRMTGSQPVILAIYGDAEIDGRLVVSAKGAGHGAGGPAGNCLLQGDPGFTFIYSAGGGGGAGFAQPGTRGGSSNFVLGGAGGGTFGLSPLLLLRGGCAGGDGAAGMPNQQAALGGGAGGAVQLSVSGTLSINGEVSANGGGGRGGVTFNAGGGGGGSGGGILCEANLIRLMGNAKITAHGGGGGGGARDDDDGEDGEDGHATDAVAAEGGNKGGGQAGNGGNGGVAVGPTNAEDGTTSAGGGGAAGVGRIHLRSILACQTSGGRLVSPAPTGDCP